MVPLLSVRVVAVVEKLALEPTECWEAIESSESCPSCVMVIAAH